MPDGINVDEINKIIFELSNLPEVRANNISCEKHTVDLVSIEIKG
jgi:hypothetical protein